MVEFLTWNMAAVCVLQVLQAQHVRKVVGQIGMGLHVRLYVPRQKSTAKEWCSVVQNLAATVLLG